MPIVILAAAVFLLITLGPFILAAAVIILGLIIGFLAEYGLIILAALGFGLVIMLISIFGNNAPGKALAEKKKRS